MTELRRSRLFRISRRATALTLLGAIAAYAVARSTGMIGPTSSAEGNPDLSIGGGA